MKIKEAIQKCDSMRPNMLKREMKQGWLGALDAQIWTEIVSTHEGAPAEYEPITHETSEERELLAPETYADVYIFWLLSQIDLCTEELPKYSNDKTLFNNSYLTLADYYNRTHMPLDRIKYFHL